MIASTMVPNAAELIALELGGPVVKMVVDGARLLAAFELDPVEHRRRLDLNVGALTSTGLLHGLWMLPAGGCVPAQSLPEVKRARLRAAPHTVVEHQAGFERTYAPPGVVRGVAFQGRDAAGAVDRAARYTPIFRRFVLVDGSRGIAASMECVAREWGVGVIALDSDSASVLVPACGAVVGVPSVYRWWIAELAYRSMLYEMTQPVS